MLLVQIVSYGLVGRMMATASRQRHRDVVLFLVLMKMRLALYFAKRRSMQGSVRVTERITAQTRE